LISTVLVNAYFKTMPTTAQADRAVANTAAQVEKLEAALAQTKRRKKEEREASKSPPVSDPGGIFRPVEEADVDLFSAPTTPVAVPGGPASANQYDEMKNFFTGLMGQMQVTMQTQTHALSENVATLSDSMEKLSVSFTAEVANLQQSMTQVTARVAAIEAETALKFKNMDLQMIERMAAMEAAHTDKMGHLESMIKSQSEAADRATASSSTAASPAWLGGSRASGPAPALGPPRRNDENCIVVVRGFPEKLPRAVLLETFDECRKMLPDHRQGEVQHRIGPADNQILMVFPSPGAADSFVSTFRSEQFIYVDQETKDRTSLVVSKGRPLAVRRRGFASHPIYAKVEHILKPRTPSMKPKILQTFSLRGGTPQTEFLLERGRKATPLFTVTFRETEFETTVVAIDFVKDAFSDSECEEIIAAAGLA
jgi:hypothetical protein